MSLRLPLVLPFVALAVLALSGCKKDQPAPAPQASRDCCCKQSCPTDAAPAAQATARGDAGAVATERRQVARVSRSASSSRQAHRERGYRSGAGSDGQVLSGGDYYASGDTARRYRGGYTGRDSDSYASSERRYERYDGGRYDSGRSTEERRYEGERYAGGRYEDGRHGGRYGDSGRARSGVSISVEESESSSERIRYRESSSSYASGSSGHYATGGGYYAATGYYEDRDGRVRRAGPAATDHSGYLTWPGKVEEED